MDSNILSDEFDYVSERRAFSESVAEFETSHIQQIEVDRRERLVQSQQEGAFSFEMEDFFVRREDAFRTGLSQRSNLKHAGELGWGEVDLNDVRMSVEPKFECKIPELDKFSRLLEPLTFNYEEARCKLDGGGLTLYKLSPSNHLFTVRIPSDRFMDFEVEVPDPDCPLEFGLDLFLLHHLLRVNRAHKTKHKTRGRSNSTVSPTVHLKLDFDKMRLEMGFGFGIIGDFRFGQGTVTAKVPLLQLYRTLALPPPLSNPVVHCSIPAYLFRNLLESIPAAAQIITLNFATHHPYLYVTTLNPNLKLTYGVGNLITNYHLESYLDGLRYHYYLAPFKYLNPALKVAQSMQLKANHLGTLSLSFKVHRDLPAHLVEIQIESNRDNS